LPAEVTTSPITDMLVYLMPLFALIALFTAFLLYRPSIADWLGRAKVRRVLAALPTDRYTVLHDLLLPYQNGSYTRIAHIVVGPTAVFVIESRSEAGLIFGRAPEPQWRQLLHRRSKFSFSNPLRSNERHMQAVRDAVGELPVRSVVVFVRGTFQGEWPEGVVTPALLRTLIAEQEEEGQAIDMPAVAEELQGAAITAKTIRRQQRKAERKQQADPLRLPIAHALVLLAIALLALMPRHLPHPAPAVQAKAAAPAKYAIPAPPPAPAAPRPKVKTVAPAAKKTLRRAPAPSSFEIIALGHGRVSLRIDGRIFSLRVGQKSHGWRLLSASPLHADLIRPDGKQLHYEP